MADWDAEQYHRLSNPQLGWGRRVLERLAPVAGERVLDLGCGTGRLTAELVDVLGQGLVVGVDRSETMLREASALRARPDAPVTDTRPLGPHLVETEAARPTVSFVLADGACLPFVDAFDAVFSTATFHWILDHDALFSSIYRALAPGGRLVAQCGGGRNLRDLLDRADALIHAEPFASRFEGWRDPWEFADVPTTIQRLDRAGFTAIDVNIEEAPTTLADRTTYRDFLATVCVRHHLTRLDDDGRRQFLDLLADQAADDAPPFTLDYWRLNIHARKPTTMEQAAA